MTRPSRQLAASALFATLTALGGYLAIPLQPVPITLQTLFTYLAGSILGARLGALSQLLYLMMGALGLPVFAGGRGGPGVLLGPTGGYLAGFVVAAALIGGLTARRQDFLGSLVGVVVGTLPIYGLGVLQLTLWLHLHKAATLAEGLARAIAVGVVPFLPGDGIKALAAAYIASRPQVKLAKERYLGRVRDG